MKRQCVKCLRELKEGYCNDCRILYLDPSNCLSTHGCAGYLIGTVIAGEDAICPGCGTVTPVRRAAVGGHCMIR
jgi:hypothetical protein